MRASTAWRLAARCCWNHLRTWARLSDSAEASASMRGGSGSVRPPLHSEGGGARGRVSHECQARHERVPQLCVARVRA